MVAPEYRCSPYDKNGDYPYPQAVEREIVRRLGAMYGPYTGTCFGSTRETDIEHIVATSEAHDSGICARDRATRTRFARDPRNLTLAAPHVDRHQKSAKDATEWLPDRNRCWFPARVVEVRRAKLYRDETYRGYQASKRRYFYGLKVHLMVTSEGQPVECVLTPGSVADVQALKSYAYDLPPGSVVYADKAYNDYEIEDLLAEMEDIHLLPIRKKNSKRPLSASRRFLQSYHRKRVETAGSQLMGLFPKSLHAVSASGFELKVALFVLAYSFDCYFKFVATL